MRTAVTALVIVAFLGIWLTTQYPDDTVPNPELTRHAVPPVPMPQESRLPIADRGAFQVTAPDEAIADAIETDAFRGPAMQTPEIKFGPEMRVEIADHFLESGLAVVDSERIADSVLGGLGECVAQALGNVGEVTTSNDIETCMFNVYADHGLTGDPVTETSLSINSIVLP